MPVSRAKTDVFLGHLIFKDHKAARRKIPQALADFQKRRNYLMIIDEAEINLNNGIIADKEIYKNITSEFVLFYDRNYSQLIPNKTN
jgi:hypothetical protein